MHARSVSILSVYLGCTRFQDTGLDFSEALPTLHRLEMEDTQSCVTITLRMRARELAEI